MAVYQVHLWCQGWPCLPSLLSGTLNVLQVPPLWTEGSWHTFNHVRMLKFSTQVGNPMSRTLMRANMTHVLHVRNLQCPPSHWGWWEESWYTSNHARKLKFGTQAGNPMSRTIMRSRMTRPPCLWLGTLNVLEVTDDDGVVLDTLLSC